MVAGHERGERRRVVAVLGPTNTGKTHLAMERMLAHESGMIGFPLRLLARENYDRAVRLKGASSVALITGEEKIVPPRARYFLCTVEAMPLGRRVSFLAIDEIQMCADADRGHVFTDRLLHARGAAETMFMGAETVRPLLRRLVPEAEITTRARFSTLSYAGHRKLHRLPPRSAIVSFTAADVYAIAELIRRQRGGAAVVLGALSPRTRNAQVGMYQAGEVDYLVATDAIGMGLNMDINHVAFAATCKFDGRQVRHLTPAELGQIAGRAGRHMNDGCFGTTADTEGLDADAIDRVESHRFDALRQLSWRNSRLSFASVASLQASLRRLPDRPGLVRVREADDERVLAVLAADPEVQRLATGADAVRLLWEVCQVPDFRKVMSDHHARLLARLFRFLSGSEAACLPTDWIARQVDRLDRVDGDIDTLMQRIAHVRTWTYVSYRGDWVADAAHWQDRTRGIEDRLSDALHDRLIQRFVDRRTSVLFGRLKARRELMAAVTGDGEVVVEGEAVGNLEGFRFRPDAAVSRDGAAPLHTAAKAVNGAAHRVVRQEVPKRVQRLEADGDDAFALTDDGWIAWRQAPVGRLVPGHDVLHPLVEPCTAGLLEAEARERVRRRLLDWLRRHVQTRLAPLFQARAASLAGAARGLAFQTAEALGSMPCHACAPQLAALNAADRSALRALGLSLGRDSVYFREMLKPDAMALRALLWSVHRRLPPLAAPPPGRVSVRRDADVPADFYAAIGFRVLGALAVRIDMAERLAGRIRALARHGQVEPGRESGREPGRELATLIGCSRDDLPGVIEALGFERRLSENGAVFAERPRHPRTSVHHRPRRRSQAAGTSPFAKLRELTQLG
ncbi:MAG: disulfide oxidoreductase [Rhodospirillales bacterium]|nr:MAG: disulfide oxidoreductase [Rhodospirillales bacterium]